MIQIDPRNSNVVYVAAEGSVWGPNEERGLYKNRRWRKKTWTKILNVSENTGINNVVLHPENPDIIYATAEQRRRHSSQKKLVEVLSRLFTAQQMQEKKLGQNH